MLLDWPSNESLWEVKGRDKDLGHLLEVGTLSLARNVIFLKCEVYTRVLNLGSRIYVCS